MNRIAVLAVLGALLIAGCGTSKAEENAKSAKTRFTAGQPCAATTLEPTEPTYKTACEAQQRKEKSEREEAEKREAAERKAKEKHEQAEHKAEEAKTKREEAKTKAEEEKTKREEAKTTEAKPEEHASTSESGRKKVPSDLVGKALPQAESELEGLGIQFSHETINGDAVIIGGDWGVCSTTPSVGEPATGSIVLHLGHFECGA
jgi:outer membrane biosynthesis protein TonB